jgi:hypothetical protein
MRIRYGHIVLVALVGACMSAWSVAGNGLRASDSSWFHGRWQARIELSQGLNRRRHIDPYSLIANPVRSPLRGLEALHGYYFDGGVDPDAAPDSAGGLCATGGLVVAPRSKHIFAPRIGFRIVAVRPVWTFPRRRLFGAERRCHPRALRRAGQHRSAHPHRLGDFALIWV